MQVNESVFGGLDYILNYAKTKSKYSTLTCV